MKIDKIRAGVIGSNGYTGGELIRILLHHPNVELNYCYSRSQQDKYIYEIHHDLFYTQLKFTDSLAKQVDVVFLCLPHGETKKFLAQHSFSSSTKIIDLSNDFRLKAYAQEFIYGLPELNKNKIQQATKIANPGCFATAIQLSLLPLASKQLIKYEINVSAITGSTGAGASLSDTSHFTWRNNNMSTYKVLTHQHNSEINESLTQLQPTYTNDLYFVPYRGNFTRGIIATSILTIEEDLNQLKEIYNEFYLGAMFTKISNTPIHLKQVINSNYCLLHLAKEGKKLIITAVIDNLLKGASGQAVQNMNLMFGLNETQGLMGTASLY